PGLGGGTAGPTGTSRCASTVVVGRHATSRERVGGSSPGGGVDRTIRVGVDVRGGRRGAVACRSSREIHARRGGGRSRAIAAGAGGRAGGGNGRRPADRTAARRRNLDIGVGRGRRGCGGVVRAGDGLAVGEGVAGGRAISARRASQADRGRRAVVGRGGRGGRAGGGGARSGRDEVHIPDDATVGVECALRIALGRRCVGGAAVVACGCGAGRCRGIGRIATGVFSMGSGGATCRCRRTGTICRRRGRPCGVRYAATRVRVAARLSAGRGSKGSCRA